MKMGNVEFLEIRYFLDFAISNRSNITARFLASFEELKFTNDKLHVSCIAVPFRCKRLKTFPLTSYLKKLICSFHFILQQRSFFVFRLKKSVWASFELFFNLRHLNSMNFVLDPCMGFYVKYLCF